MIMGAVFNADFYFKETLSQNSVHNIIRCFTKNGVSFLAYDDKSRSYKKSIDRAFCFVNDDLYTSGLFGPKVITIKPPGEPRGKNRRLGNCMDLILKHGYGYITTSYEDIAFKVYFNLDKNNVSIESENPLSFTHSENQGRNFHSIVFLADAVWEATKPFFGSAGINLEIETKELESGKLPDYLGAFAFFSKELVEKIGKEKIISKASKKTPKEIKEFEDGSMRIIIHDYEITNGVKK